MVGKEKKNWWVECERNDTHKQYKKKIKITMF